MSARAQSSGIKPIGYVVLVETRGGKDCVTVGGYRTFAKADGDRGAWDGTEDRSCSVEPIYSREDYLANRSKI